MMLASQLASAPQAARSPLILQVTTASSTAILRSTGLPRRSRHPQHVRSFRFGLWSSYLDPAFQKELEQRHRVIKHKYSEALNRKLSWDRQHPVYRSRWGLKGFTCSSWHGSVPRPGGRWVNVDDLGDIRAESRATDRGIEDVEQNALDKLFGQRDSEKVIYNDSVFGWTWAARNSTPIVSDIMGAKGTSEARTNDGPASGNDGRVFETATMATSELEYDIDPITNRKVFRKRATKSEGRSEELDQQNTEIPVKTFRGYRSQFSKFGPPIANDGGKVIHLDSMEPSGSGRPVEPRTPEVEDELDSYKPFKYNEPDGQLPEKPDAVSEGLSDFDHLYKPFKYNEPDGQMPEKPDPVAKGLKDYDHQPAGGNFQGYKPFTYNGPDGQLPKFPDPVADCLGDSDRRSTDSWLSNEGFSSDAGLGQGEWAPVSQHKKSIAIEPSLDRSPQSQLSTSNAADVDKLEDLDLLRASDVQAASGIIKGPKKETQVEKDSRRAAMEADFDKPQSLEASYAEEIAAAQKAKGSRQRAQDLEIECSELLNHHAHARGRVNAKIAELDAEMAAESASSGSAKKMTGNFVRDFPEEFSGAWRTKDSLTNDCLVPKSDTDAWGYDKSPKGLELSYQQEMETAIQSAENDYVAEVASQDRSSSGAEPTRLQTSLNRKLAALDNKVQAEGGSYTKEPQGLETSYAEELAKKGESDLPMFVSSYGCQNQASHPAETEKIKKDNGRSIKNEMKKRDKELVREIRSIYESNYGTIDCKHRQVPINYAQPADTLQQSHNVELEVAIQRLEQEVREGQYYIHERYGDLAKALAKLALVDNEVQEVTKEIENKALTRPQTSSSPAEPTLYKILAYDPIMQAINIAETTSIVTDTSSALTPAEVLLRLSNPAKFFPHFQPLQSQGYEIVSGGGDVLVFRKVRDGSPVASVQSEADSAKSSSLQFRKVVNPIDGMQSVPHPATGNFASPTGFVNHDLPSEPPFISGIDVRREEPVFSGRRSEWQDSEGNEEAPGRKAKKTGRRLVVGAAWVAACSYAVGVVAEFFRTGGSDGKGPVGF